jgi:putative FmdB family regulatory protein
VLEVEMPIYDYVCASCGHEVEVVHSVIGRGPATCGECGGPMKKAISAPAVHFKGGGWARKERSGSRRPGRAEAGSASSTAAESSGGAVGAQSKTDSASPTAAESSGGAVGAQSKTDSASKDPD